MASTGAEEGGRSVVAARLEVFGAEPTQARMVVTELGPSARLKRSLGALAVGWGAAGVSVFFPVVHFVLVPSFFLGGIATAVTLGRQANRVTSVSGTCPRCLTPETFDASGKVRRERLVTCPNCHANLTLRVEDGRPIPDTTARS